MGFSQSRFNELVLDSGVIGFFEEPITLKSGRTSHWYVNWRTATADARTLDEVTGHVTAFVESLGLEPDCFYGVPEGATKLGVLTQMKWARDRGFERGSHPVPMGRAKPKEHGAPKDRFFVGSPEGDVVVVEDVTTTGGSLMETLDTLQEIGVDVVAALGLTNRNEVRDDGRTVEEAVEEMGVPYHALSNAVELLPEACRRDEPSGEVVEAVERYFDEYGTESIELR